MNPKIMKSFVLGAITAYGFAALVLVSFAKLGILPVQADVAPSRLEASLLGSALRASVARHAPSGGNPIPASDENLIAGAKLYRQMCSRCHGLSRESGNTYGQSFYPPAPRGNTYGQSFYPPAPRLLLSRTSAFTKISGSTGGPIGRAYSWTRSHFQFFSHGGYGNWARWETSTLTSWFVAPVGS